MKKAGRPPRPAPKAYAIWCGQISHEDRNLILEYLTAEERYRLLINAARERATMASTSQNPPTP